MRQTQHEQIQSANFAYIVAINASHTRFAIYLQTGNSELSVLWPGDTENTTKVQENGTVKHWHAPLLPYQVYSKSEKLPAFHFHLKGYGYNKADELRRELLAINPALEVRKLAIGWNPSALMI